MTVMFEVYRLESLWNFKFLLRFTLMEGAFQLAVGAPEVMPSGYAATTTIQLIKRWVMRRIKTAEFFSQFGYSSTLRALSKTFSLVNQ